MTAEHTQTKDLNFLNFAKYEPYRAVNRELLRRTVELLPNEGFVHLDIGAGTLLVAQEMIKLCQKMGKKGKIICVEPDRFALTLGRNDTPTVDGIRVEAVQGNGESLPVRGQIDSFSMHDAIHEVCGRKNKEQVLNNVFALLKPGGRGTINSAFTTIAMEEGQAYALWAARAFRDFGGRGKRPHEKPAFSDDGNDSTKTYSPDEYKAMMQNAGFKVNITIKNVTMSFDALRDIARYPRFVQGIREEFQPKEEGGKIPTIPELSEALVRNVVKLTKPLNRAWVDFELEKPLEPVA